MTKKLPKTYTEFKDDVSDIVNRLNYVAKIAKREMYVKTVRPHKDSPDNVLGYVEIGSENDPYWSTAYYVKGWKNYSKSIKNALNHIESDLAGEITKIHDWMQMNLRDAAHPQKLDLFHCAYRYFI